MTGRLGRLVCAAFAAQQLTAALRALLSVAKSDVKLAADDAPVMATCESICPTVTLLTEPHAFELTYLPGGGRQRNQRRLLMVMHKRRVSV
ncbi:MAG: hypothetical protein AB7N24_15180 [Dehalococcoidia bacterium]